MGAIKEIKTKLQNAHLEYILGGIIVCLFILTIFITWSGWLFNPPRVSSDLDLRTLPPKTQQNAVARIIKGGNLDDCAAAAGVNIQGVDYEQICRDNVAAELALSHLDISYCEKISGDPSGARRQCVERVVLAKMRKDNDLKACDLATNEEMANLCRSWYWQEQSAISSDIKKCDAITQPAEHTACRDRFLFEALIKDYGAVNCADFSESLQRDCRVYKEIVGSGTHNISACNDITIDELALNCRGKVEIKPE